MDGNSLIASFMISTIGFGFFTYGKKQARAPHLAAGLLLMLYPYFVSNVLIMLGIAVLLIGLLWVATKAGI